MDRFMQTAIEEAQQGWKCSKMMNVSSWCAASSMKNQSCGMRISGC